MTTTSTPKPGALRSLFGEGHAAAVEIRLGDWRDVLADVKEVDAVITDPPYGGRTHDGHNARTRHDGGEGRDLTYSSWGPWDVVEFVEAWAPRCRGWFVAMTSHDLVPTWEDTFNRMGWYPFAPLPIVYPDSVRNVGDGPASACVWLVARPRRREFMSWGSLQGWHPATRKHGGHIGGKDPQMVRRVVGDYTNPGDLVCDPCAGYGTILAEARMLGCPGVGAEIDEDTHRHALANLARGYTPLPHPRAGRMQGKPKQGALW